MYYFEVILTFLFFIVLGTLFSPFLGGCLVLILTFFILGLVIVFFSLNFVWFLAAGLVIYVYGIIRKYIKWYKLPEISQYLTEHPECKLEVGVACYRCGSEHIEHNGLFSKKSKLRFYTCCQCGSTLFRFKVL